MITPDPLNYVPTDAEIHKTRMILEWSRQEQVNALSAVKGRAELEACPGLASLVYDTICHMNQAIEWSDNLIIAAVKRYDNRIEGRPGKSSDGR